MSIRDLTRYELSLAVHFSLFEELHRAKQIEAAIDLLQMDSIIWGDKAQKRNALALTESLDAAAAKIKTLQKKLQWKKVEKTY